VKRLLDDFELFQGNRFALCSPTLKLVNHPEETKIPEITKKFGFQPAAQVYNQIFKNENRKAGKSVTIKTANNTVYCLKFSRSK
jgi:hypothetical protein